jgi:hypothetical protein
MKLTARGQLGNRFICDRVLFDLRQMGYEDVGCEAGRSSDKIL